MTPPCNIWHFAMRWPRDEKAGVLVEFAIVVSLFLFMMFSVIDFGRLAFSHVTAEKAVQIAARRAIVRPPACAGVPERYSRGVVPGGTPAPRFGTSCRTASYVCAPVATVSCAGSAANPTAQEIWTQISPLLPSNATLCADRDRHGELAAISVCFAVGRACSRRGCDRCRNSRSPNHLPGFQRFISGRRPRLR